MGEKRTPLRWAASAAIIAVCVSIIWSVFAITRSVQRGVDRVSDKLSKPGVPEPGPAETAAVVLTAEGVPLTIKQRTSAWLPGGQHKLHLDDITSNQVLISVTDRNERVIMSPRSVHAGETITLRELQPPIRLEVRRLVNTLTGEDFGEFIVKPEE